MKYQLAFLLWSIGWRDLRRNFQSFLHCEREVGLRLKGVVFHSELVRISIGQHENGLGKGSFVIISSDSKS